MLIELNRISRRRPHTHHFLSVIFTARLIFHSLEIIYAAPISITAFDAAWMKREKDKWIRMDGYPWVNNNACARPKVSDLRPHLTTAEIEVISEKLWARQESEAVISHQVYFSLGSNNTPVHTLRFIFALLTRRPLEFLPSHQCSARKFGTREIWDWCMSTYVINLDSDAWNLGVNSHSNQNIFFAILSIHGSVRVGNNHLN